MAVYTSSLLVESVFSHFDHFTLTFIKVIPFRIKGADKMVNKTRNRNQRCFYYYLYSITKLFTIF